MIKKVIRNRVAFIELNNEKKLNALTWGLSREFHDAVVDCGDARALVLTGAGAHFSAGGDLDFIRARMRDSAENNVREMRELYSAFVALFTHVRVPTIAAVQGRAVGGGAVLPLMADVRLCTRDASFCFNFSRLGVHPGLGSTFLLPRAVGEAAAARLLLTGDVVGAAEARALGLVSEVVDDAVALRERAEELGGTLAAARAPPVLAALVEDTRRAPETHAALERALQREAERQSQSFASPELRTGIEAIVAKRTPKFI